MTYSFIFIRHLEDCLVMHVEFFIDEQNRKNKLCFDFMNYKLTAFNSPFLSAHFHSGLNLVRIFE